LPVWMTEFSFVDWGGDQTWSEEDTYQCLAEFVWRAETFAPIRKYGLFVFTESADSPQPVNSWQRVRPGPRSNSYYSTGSLTPYGKLYAAWDGDATVRPNKPYIIHHKGSRKRVANLLAGGPDGQTIRVDGQSVNWTLVPTGTPGNYYLVSTRDGRRLSSVNGAAPTLAPAGSTGPNLEWSLSSVQHGWHYLAHPASGRRLHLSFDNTTQVATYTMATSSTVGTEVEWRFIVPLPDNAAPILSPIPPQVTNELTRFTFTASATDADLPVGQTL